MKKSSKRFVISTEAENSKQFHVRTSGIDLSAFGKNPLLLWLHKMPTGESKDEVLPLGYWDDLKVKDGMLTGVPVFDDTDKFALSIYNKVENGTIRMASAGLLPLEMEEIEGQSWLEKSRLIEASLVPSGSNPEALAISLYNKNEELMTLSEYTQLFKIKNNDMKLIQLNASELCPLVKLNDDAKPEEVMKVLTEKINLANEQATQIVILSTDLDKAKTAKTEAETKLADHLKESNTEKITKLMDESVGKGKITTDEKAIYIELADGNFDKLEKLMAAKAENPSVIEKVKSKESAKSEELLKLSYDELDKSGKLIQLKADHPEVFKEKFKAKYGTEYKG